MTRRTNRRWVFGCLLALGVASASALPAGAQVAWDAPLMVGTANPVGWGVYLSDPSPGAGVGVFTSWRTGGAWGFRIGLAEDARDDLAVFGGADLSGSLLRVSDEMPVDLVWVAGGGFGIGEHSILSFPLGLSAGRTLLADAVALTPWLGPRVILDAWLGDDPPRDALDLGLAVDVGLDVAFESGWTVRFAGSFGDREALAIGINFLVF